MLHGVKTHEEPETLSVVKRISSWMDSEVLTPRDPPLDNPMDLFHSFKKATHLSDLSSSTMLRVLQFFQYEENEPEAIPLPPIYNIVFQGGGAKGGAYIGANLALEKDGRLDELRCIAGASAGSMNALFLGLGFDSEQIRYILRNLNLLDFKDLKENSWASFFKGSFLGIGADMITNGACYTGDAVHKWASALIEEILGDKNATFRDLEEKRKTDPTLKKVIFKATRYPAKDGTSEETFSYEDTPDVPIADALSASIAYPGAFLPREVRKKENGQFVYFGTFADGGILNNWPAEVFNRQEYYDAKYRPIQRKAEHNQPIQINPCVLGFSLTELEDLKEEITPLSRKLQALKSQTSSASLPTASSSPPGNYQWHFSDMVKAAWWNIGGVSQLQDLSFKQKIYHDQTVQIYPENVATLDFQITPEKKSDLIQSGFDATDLWLKKFRAPHLAYTQKKQSKPFSDSDSDSEIEDTIESEKQFKKYDDRLTDSEQEQRRKNIDEFFLKKSQEYFLFFIQEMNREYQHHKTDNSGIKKNVRLRYYANKLLSLLQEMRELRKSNLFKKSLYLACHHLAAQKISIDTCRKKRWQLLVPEELLNKISQEFMLESSPNYERILHLLEGQLSNVIPLVQKIFFSQQGNKKVNLIGLVIQSNNIGFVKSFFRILNCALDQCYLQGRLKNPKEMFRTMLNEIAIPPVLYTALKLKNDDMLRMLLEYGADPTLSNFVNSTHPILESIKDGRYSSFKILMDYVTKKRIDPMYYIINIDSLFHNLIRHANSDFIEDLLNDNAMLARLRRFHREKTGLHNLTVPEWAAYLSPSMDDARWKLVSTVWDDLDYHRLRTSAEEKYQFSSSSIIVLNNLLAGFKEAKDLSVVKEFRPQTCLRILELPVSDDLNQLATLAQDKQHADLLIALCQRANEDEQVKFELSDMLNEKYCGKTPFFYACEYGNPAFVKYVLDSYPNIEIDQAGTVEEPSAVFIAAKSGDYHTMNAVAKMLSIDPHELEKIRLNSPDLSNSIMAEEEYYKKEKDTYVRPESFEQAKLPLLELAQYPNAIEILQKIVRYGNRKHPYRLFKLEPYRLDRIYDWPDPLNFLPGEEPAYPELEILFKSNPTIYHFLIANIQDSDADKAERIDILIKKRCAVGEKPILPAQRRFLGKIVMPNPQPAHASEASPRNVDFSESFRKQYLKSSP